MPDFRHPRRVSLPPGLSFTSPAPGWARSLADFDALAFGRDAWPFDLWVEELTGRRSVYLVVVRDAGGIAALPEIVAVGGVGLGLEAEILTIAVAEGERGRGIGGALLDALIERARGAGAQDVFLEVRSRDRLAQRLYIGRGFVAVGLRKRYYGDDDAVLMRLRLIETRVDPGV